MSLGSFNQRILFLAIEDGLYFKIYYTITLFNSVYGAKCEG